MRTLGALGPFGMTKGAAGLPWLDKDALRTLHGLMASLFGGRRGARLTDGLSP